MASVSSVDLAGRRVLVVEDEFVIALDMEQMLRRLGADTVDLAASLADALAAIERTPPALVILDLKLRADSTVPIAEALQVCAIPMIFVTGYGDLDSLPESLRCRPLLRKPIDFATLTALVSDIQFPAPRAGKDSRGDASELA